MAAVDRLGNLGILGGGQLARMTAHAARHLGYAVRVLDPSPQCAARSAVERVIEAPLTSVEHARELAAQSDVVTIDTEHVPADVLVQLARMVEVHPSAHVLAIVQDRGAQKRWLERRGYPVGDYRYTRSEPELEAALRAWPGTLYVKRRREGYDGRGQAKYEVPPSATEVIRALGSAELIVERAVPYQRELSVLVARGRRGELAVYPPAHNHHERGVLAWSVFPASLPAAVTQRAQELAASLARDLEVCGLLCVEMFLTHDGELLVNELAPRPHNSYHATERGAQVDQFEQLVRAVSGLPLGSTAVRKPAAICNLLGELWREEGGPNLREALSLPGVTVQLYGKLVAQPGRKMGHLTAVADTPEEACALVQRAFALAREGR
ncbi:MAG TPA: 5-(carboxyamino)imidazole ribonucleotide synthase [Polyangiales bacterium]